MKQFKQLKKNELSRSKSSILTQGKGSPVFSCPKYRKNRVWLNPGSQFSLTLPYRCLPSAYGSIITHGRLASAWNQLKAKGTASRAGDGIKVWLSWASAKHMTLMRLVSTNSQHLPASAQYSILVPGKDFSKQERNKYAYVQFSNNDRYNTNYHFFQTTKDHSFIILGNIHFQSEKGEEKEVISLNF